MYTFGGSLLSILRINTITITLHFVFSKRTAFKIEGTSN